jgi:Domain of unknown function (DUF4136)
MKRAASICVALLLMFAWTARAQDVRYNFDKGTDFSKFKTYKWVAIKDAQKVDDITDKQIKDAIDSVLATKGLEKTTSDDADLYIGYQTAIGQEKQYTSFNSGWGYGPGWGGGWYGGGMNSSMTTGTTSTIYTGQLALDMYDRNGHDLVWRGVASKTIDTKAKPDKRQKNLNKAAAKMLKNYPPPIKS